MYQEDLLINTVKHLNLLSSNHTKWLDTLKQFVANNRRIV